MNLSQIVKKLTPEQEEIVLKEVGYTRKQLSSDVKQIRDWLKDQHHLPLSRLKESDTFLEYFLTGCKGSLENVKKKLDNYYTFRSHSEIYDSLDPLEPMYRSVAEVCLYAPTPYASNTGVRLFICSIKDCPLEKFDSMATARNFINRCEVLIRNISFSSSVYLLLDFKDVSKEIYLKMNLRVLSDLKFVVQQGTFPMRFIKINAINVPGFAAVFINKLIRPLFSAKLKDRFLVTEEGHEDLLNYFTPNILPSDYGGDSCNPTLKEYWEMWAEYETENRKWYLNDLSERVDESKRIIVDNANPNDNFFGAYGSLKKLEID